MLLALLFATTAYAGNPDVPLRAQIPIDLSVGFGSSLPGQKDGAYLSERGPSRANGGETITFRFREGKTIASIRLTAYSKSGRGKVLIREVSGTNGQTETALESLYRFDQARGGENHNGLVMLANNAGVYAEPVARFTELKFKVEGYTHNDSTLLVDLESQDGFANEDFVVSRANGDAIGGYFDEGSYKDFRIGDLKNLIENGTNPTLGDLAGTTWVCSQYGAVNGDKDLDRKTRQYFSPSEGLLQSTTDLNGTPATWILTQSGWRLPLSPFEGNCGALPAWFMLRKSPGGNLVLETASDRDQIYRMCGDRGFSRDSIDQYLRQYTTGSKINSRYVVTAYEFCRPARIDTNKKDL